MDSKEAELEARKQSDIELRIRVGTKDKSSQSHIFAQQELDRRKRCRSFWRKDIIAWAALALSIISLFKQYLK
jgi:hypothetical protein